MCTYSFKKSGPVHTVLFLISEDTMTSGVYVEDNSSFMAYFLLTAIVCIIAYLVFHNKQKVWIL